MLIKPVHVEVPSIQYMRQIIEGLNTKESRRFERNALVKYKDIVNRNEQKIEKVDRSTRPTARSLTQDPQRMIVQETKHEYKQQHSVVAWSVTFYPSNGVVGGQT